MNFNDFFYQVAKRWYSNTRDRKTDTAVMGMGISGEAAEVAKECLDLCMATGTVTDRLKKEVRGSGPVDLDKLVLELGDVAHYWCAIVNHYGIDPNVIFEANIDKLNQRDAAKK